MQDSRFRPLEYTPWKKFLDRLAVAWIVCAPLLTLAAGWSGDEDRQVRRQAAATADRMALPTTPGVVLTSHIKEERVERSAPGLRRARRGDCDR